jgi:hypothetical protein
MRKFLRFLCCSIVSSVSLFFVCCVDEEELPNTPSGNFEALWKIIDEHYCFLDYKQHQVGLDWQAVYDKYKVRVSPAMDNRQLFEVLAAMLSELQDGHVNLTAAHDYARNWSWYEEYPANYSDSLERIYMGRDYKIASGLSYRVLDDNVGYIRYESFQDGIGDGNLNEVLSSLITCSGLIIDIRNNGGGNLTNAHQLAARFVQQKTLVGYIQHKTGKGHSDFSQMEPRYLEPSSQLRWHKGVCVLTNRHVYSAANEFAMMMHALPNVKLVGDRTGGGAGMPFNSSLPNGWNVRFSAVPLYDAQRQPAEFGVEPDYSVSITDEDFRRGRDTIIEKARELLTK